MPTKKKGTKKMGRPKKSPALLPAGWETEVITLYATGASDVEIRAWLCNFIDTLNPRTWQRWIMDGQLAESTDTSDLDITQRNEYLHFSQTIKKGRLLSEAWWERNGRIGILNKDFNSTLWYMNMKNRFGWRDKPAEDDGGDINIYVTETVAPLKRVS